MQAGMLKGLKAERLLLRYYPNPIIFYILVTTVKKKKKSKNARDLEVLKELLFLKTSCKAKHPWGDGKRIYHIPQKEKK